MLLETLLDYRRSCGSAGALKYIYGKLTGTRPLTALRQAAPRFLIRARTSDLLVSSQIFEENQYQYNPPRPLQTIVDAGANIGCSAVYFAQKHPAARIVCIEPDRANFELLQRNTSHYPNVECLQAALWSSATEIVVIDPGSGEWGLRAVGVDTDLGNAKVRQRLQGVDLDWLRRTYDMSTIDMLKVDIEGGEREFLARGASVLENVNVFVVELHDRLVSGCSRAVMLATAGFDYEWARGEHLFFCREGWQPSGENDVRIARIER